MRPVRDAAALGAEIRDLVGRSQRDTVSIMEVCGTHTVSLFRSGARSFLPENLKLLSGPGCPVCVTSQGYLDAACELAARDDVIVATYGDMVRVPGAKRTLTTMARCSGPCGAAIRSTQASPANCSGGFLVVGRAGSMFIKCPLGVTWPAVAGRG